MGSHWWNVTCVTASKLRLLMYPPPTRTAARPQQQPPSQPWSCCWMEDSAAVRQGQAPSTTGSRSAAGWRSVTSTRPQLGLPAAYKARRLAGAAIIPAAACRCSSTATPSPWPLAAVSSVSVSCLHYLIGSLHSLSTSTIPSAHPPETTPSGCAHAFPPHRHSTSHRPLCSELGRRAAWGKGGSRHPELMMTTQQLPPHTCPPSCFGSARRTEVRTTLSEGARAWGS